MFKIEYIKDTEPCEDKCECKECARREKDYRQPPQYKENKLVVASGEDAHAFA